jgi:hypothetical protein
MIISPIRNFGSGLIFIIITGEHDPSCAESIGVTPQHLILLIKLKILHGSQKSFKAQMRKVYYN